MPPNPSARAVASFEIGYTQFVDKSGEPTQELPAPFKDDPAALVPLYRAMVFNRAFDQKAVALQRTGKLGTYASTLGQEAVGVGTGSAMRPDDVLLPSYREYGAQFWRGVKMKEILLYWSGDERASDFENQKIDFPICVTIAAHCCHAAGAAYALKLEGKGRAAVCSFGDGATSKGDFYEGMNAAGAYRLPVVFLSANNQYAISVPRSKQTAAETIAQKAIAAGIRGEQVDGNDVIAVHWAVSRALERARAGEGPTLIEALTYRLHDHTTADDASRYRSKEEVSRQWGEEPILRVRNLLAKLGVWTKDQEEALIHEAGEEVQRQVEEYLATPPPGPEDMFTHLYAELPQALVAQREESLKWKGTHHG
jgi:2-oxoisovalerate dehydrogenase E1 component alpha subunit